MLYKHVLLSLFLLCTLCMASAPRAIPETIVRIIFDYASEDFIKVPLGAIVAVYNDGLIFWYNNIYGVLFKDQDLQKHQMIMKSTEDLGDHFAIPKYLAVSNTGRTIAWALKGSGQTFVAQGKCLMPFKHQLDFPALISSDDKKALHHPISLLTDADRRSSRNWAIVGCLGLLLASFCDDIKIHKLSLPLAIVLLILKAKMMRRMYNFTFSFTNKITGQRFVIHDLPTLMPIASTNNVRGTTLRDLSINFERVSTETETRDELSIEPPHPAIQQISPSGGVGDYSPASLYKDPRETLKDERIFSMDGQTVASIKDTEAHREITILRRPGMHSFDEFLQTFDFNILNR